MRLNCTINGNPYNLNVNTDKSLASILEENIGSFPINCQCRGAGCGNCIVILNDSYVLSCLVPAYKISGANIVTYEGFSKTLDCHDIEKAYSELDVKPCSQCYASKTLLISSIIEKIEKERQNHKITLKARVSKLSLITSSFIANEMKLINCHCMEIAQIEKVIKLVLQYRTSRYGHSE